jgi:hypothetical protein
MHIATSMRIATWRIGPPMRARTAHARTCCAHVRARVDACFGAPVSAPNRASPFRRRRPCAARCAGFLLCVGVQREHRRVEHSLGHLAVPSMRLLRPRGVPPQASRTRSAGLRCGAAGCARRHRRCARACHTWRHSLARGRGCGYGCAEERFDISVHEKYVSLFTHILYVYIYIYVLESVGVNV